MKKLFFYLCVNLCVCVYVHKCFSFMILNCEDLLKFCSVFGKSSEQDGRKYT